MNSKTAIELKSIAKDMGLKGYSKLTKPALIALIESAIPELHIQALAENSLFNARTKLATTVTIPAGTTFTDRMTNRLNGYSMQTGTDRLTPRQARRYRHKMNAERGRTL